MIQRISTVAALASAMALPSCRDDRGARPAAAALASPQDAASRSDLWWFDVRRDDLVAVWLSPEVGALRGGRKLRFVNVLFHRAGGGGNPFGAVCRPVQPEDPTPVQLRDTDVRVVVQPRAGRTWRDVEKRDDLDVQIEGL